MHVKQNHFIPQKKKRERRKKIKMTANWIQKYRKIHMHDWQCSTTICKFCLTLKIQSNSPYYKIFKFDYMVSVI